MRMVFFTVGGETRYCVKVFGVFNQVFSQMRICCWSCGTEALIPCVFLPALLEFMNTVYDVLKYIFKLVFFCCLGNMQFVLARLEITTIIQLSPTLFITLAEFKLK